MADVIPAPFKGTPDFNQSQPLIDERAAYKALWSTTVSKIVGEFLTKQDPGILKLGTSAASLAEAPKETHEAINRIGNCRDEAHAEILNIPSDASKQDMLTAWRKLGSLVQPYMDDKTGGQAMISNNEPSFSRRMSY